MSPGFGSWRSQEWMLVTWSVVRYLCCLLLLLEEGAGAGRGLGAASHLHSGSEQTFLLRKSRTLGTFTAKDRPRIFTQTFLLSPMTCDFWLLTEGKLIVCKTSYHSDSRDASGLVRVPRFPLGAGRAHWAPIGRVLQVSTNHSPASDVTPSQSSWCHKGQTDSNLDLGK